MKRRKVVLVFLSFLFLALAGWTVLRWQQKASAQSPTAKLILYWEENFRGRYLEVFGTLADLPVVVDEDGNEFDWNDEVRSLVVVSGTWRLHQHGRCNTRLDATPLESLDLRTKAPDAGWSCLLSATSSGPLKVADAAAGGFFRDVSSVELVSGENLPDWAAPRGR